MAWRIPEDAINDLRDRVSIVEVVSNYVSLKRAGRNWLGLCPFHAEKTPSFTVSDERGLFHCFGCGAGGSVFTFLMQHERVEFREAVEMVAQRAGVQLPTPKGEDRAAGERERLVHLNVWAAKKFSEALWDREGAEAREYLRQRGVSDDIARTFGLGYAPPAGDFLARRLAGRAEALSAAARLGLLLQRDGGGGTYDRFRHRLVFPIADARGALIAFGGRTLADAQPKYLNSPESPLFRKSEVLYALPQGRDEMRKRDEAIVVEGYLDALSLIQFGVGNAVATLGTSLTSAHLRALRRLSQRVVVFFDGDNAGRKAAMRGFGVCVEAGVWAHGAFLPEGEDPDSFVRKQGAEAVRELIARAVPLSDFYFETLLTSTKGGMRERTEVAQETARLIGQARDPLERDVLIRTAAQRLGVSEEALRAAARRAPTRAGEAAPAAPTRQEPLEPRAEILLLEAMAVDQGVARAAGRQGVIEHFRNAEMAECARILVEAWERSADVARTIEAMPEAVAARLSGALLAPEVEGDTEIRLQLAEDCVRHIETEAERPLREAVRREVREASASDDTERERALLPQVLEELRGRKARP